MSQAILEPIETQDECSKSQVQHDDLRAPKHLHQQLIEMLHEQVIQQHPHFKGLLQQLSIPTSDSVNFANTWAACSTPRDQDILVKVMSLHTILLNTAITAGLNASTVIMQAKGTGQCQQPLQMRLGLYAKETEPGSEQLIRALAHLSRVLEKNAGTSCKRQAVSQLWQAINADGRLDEVTMQIFYADQIYHNLGQFVQQVNKSQAEINIDLSQWLRCYTWLSTDRDGRPHDTNEKTLHFIQRLQTAICHNYLQDLYDLQQVTKLDCTSIISKLEQGAYHHAAQLLNDLQDLPSQHELVQLLQLKVNTFGLHYLELEFRENAAMQEEVLDSLLPIALIQQCLQLSTAKPYRSLTRVQKVRLLNYLLTDLMSDQVSEIKTHFLACTEKDFLNKKQQYLDKDYIDLLDTDPDYIKQVNVRSTLGRFDIMASYPESVHVHAIAESQGPEDALAILVLAKINNGYTDHIDVALQPEDSMGAVTIIQMIADLYEEPVYMAHLQKRAMKQYIVFGPSDTGKQGGKAMHMANQTIARLHAQLAKQFDLQPIIHAILGYEHARCNGPLSEFLCAYQTVCQPTSELMLAGLNEMRSHLLAPQQTVDFLHQLLITQYNNQAELGADPAELNAKAHFWLEIVKRYQRYFHNHISLPGLLRKIARFDIINATAKGTRPPSRILNTRDLVATPSAIRAIPWSRALLLSGIHCEVLGAGHLKRYCSEFLHEQYRNDPDFRRYIQHIAYAAAHSDLDFAWQIFADPRPDTQQMRKLAEQVSSEPTSTRHLLAWIDYETHSAAAVVYQALFGKPYLEEYLDANDLIAEFNPALAQEIAWRRDYFSWFKVLLKQSHQHKQMLTSPYIKDLFSGALTICNTALSQYEPGKANQLIWQ